MVLTGKSSFLFLVLFFVIGPEVMGAYISVDRTQVTVEDFIEFTVTLEGDEELQKVENIESFNVESKGTSSNYRYINGRASSEKKINYTLTLKNGIKGPVSLGPAIISVDGKSIETNKILLKVIRDKKARSDQDKGYYLKLITDRKEAMVNETILIKVLLYNRVRLVEASIDEPKSESFFLEQYGKEKSGRQIIDGKEYNVTEITYKFTPLRPGKIQIPTFTFEGLAVVQEKRRRNQFGGFFDDSFFSSGFGKRKRIRASTMPYPLEVLNFPEVDKPTNFSGLVGDFSLKERLTKNSTNNSYRLNIQITGKGDLSTLNKLNLGGNQFYNVYEESSSNLIDGKKFNLVIIPKVNGEIVFEEQSIPYFSLKEKKYKSLLFGGQKLLFQGVDSSSYTKTETDENPEKKENLKVIGASTKGLSERLDGNDDILLVSRKNLYEVSGQSIFGYRYYLLGIFLLVFLYFVFKSYLFQEVKSFRVVSPEKKKLQKDLKSLYQKGDFNSVKAIRWLYNYRDFHHPDLKGDSSLTLFKDYVKTNKNLCKAIIKLESGQYGKKGLSHEDQLFIFQELNKLCDLGVKND